MKSTPENDERKAKMTITSLYSHKEIKSRKAVPIIKGSIPVLNVGMH